MLSSMSLQRSRTRRCLAWKTRRPEGVCGSGLGVSSRTAGSRRGGHTGAASAARGRGAVVRERKERESARVVK